MKNHQPVGDSGQAGIQPNILYSITSRSYLGQKPNSGAHLTVRAFPQTAARITPSSSRSRRRHFAAARFFEPLRSCPAMDSSATDGARLPPPRAGSRLCVRCGERKAALKRPKTLEQVRLSRHRHASVVIRCGVIVNFILLGVA